MAMTTTTRPPAVRPEELIGAWELTSYVSVDEGARSARAPWARTPGGC